MSLKLITVRFDRLKIAEINSLYETMKAYFETIDVKGLHLEWPVEHFMKHLAYTNKNDKMPRTKEETRILQQHFKALDNIVGAMQQHCKALVRAEFEDIDDAAKAANNAIKNNLHYNPNSKQFAKMMALEIFFSHPHTVASIADFELVGLSRYLRVIENHQLKITKMLDYKLKVKLEKNGMNAQNNKQMLIKGIQTFTMAYMLSTIQHPEINYDTITANMNELFIEYRALLRNRATRRLKKQEKLDVKHEDDISKAANLLDASNLTPNY